MFPHCHHQHHWSQAKAQVCLRTHLLCHHFRLVQAINPVFQANLVKSHPFHFLQPLGLKIRPQTGLLYLFNPQKHLLYQVNPAKHHRYHWNQVRAQVSHLLHHLSLADYLVRVQVLFHHRHQVRGQVCRSTRQVYHQCLWNPVRAQVSHLLHHQSLADYLVRAQACPKVPQVCHQYQQIQALRPVLWWLTQRQRVLLCLFSPQCPHRSLCYHQINLACLRIHQARHLYRLNHPGYQVTSHHCRLSHPSCHPPNLVCHLLHRQRRLYHLNPLRSLATNHQYHFSLVKNLRCRLRHRILLLSHWNHPWSLQKH